MNFKEEILHNLNEHLNIEVEAKNFYTSIIEKIKDEAIKNKINIILNQEINHIKLTQESIEAIKTHEFVIGKKVVSEDTEKIKNIVDDFSTTSSILMINRIDNQTERVLLMMKMMVDTGWNCLYVSFNKPSKLWKEQFEKNTINTKNIEFMDSIVGLEEDKAVSPEDLTRITILVNKAVQKKREKFFIVVDSISTLILYHDTATVQRFIHFMLSKMLENEVGFVGLVVENVAEKSLVESMKLLFQKTLS